MEYTTEQLASAYKALSKAQTEFDPALKDSTNPHFKSKFAALPNVINAVQPALNNNGFFLSQPLSPSENGVTVSTVLFHESGVRIELGGFFSPAAKNDPQGFGSAVTYAKRYALLAAMGIAPEDDDDGNAAVAALKTVPKAVPANQGVKASAPTMTSTPATGNSSPKAAPAPLNLADMNTDQLRQEMIQLTAAAKQYPNASSQISVMMADANKAGGVQKVSDLPAEQFRAVVESARALLAAGRTESLQEA